MTDKENIRAEIEEVKLIIQANRAQGAFAEGYLLGQESVVEHLEKFIDSLQEESKPKFKVGQTITDPTDSTFTFHINKIEDGRYIEKENEWVLVKEADANYELVEEPANEDLEKEIDRWSQEHSYNKSEKPVFAAVARHFAKWQKEIDKLIFYNDLLEFEDIKKLVVNEIASINTIETIDTDFDGWYNRLIVFAKRCAQWKKQQMLAKAIDAHIVLGPNNNHVLMNGRFNKYKWNDKVKIIIIEEDKI